LACGEKKDAGQDNRKGSMNIQEELRLLIRSKYAVVFFESADESYALAQLQDVARSEGMLFYQWSLTDGLKRGCGEGAYYQTKAPDKMLRFVLELLKPNFTQVSEDAVFVLKDLQKHLDDAGTLRFLKDAVNAVKGTRNTLVILSAEYRLPPEIQSVASHLVGGYPSEDEIRGVLINILEELKRDEPGLKILLSREEGVKIVRALKGLTVRQIQNIITRCVLNDQMISMADLAAIEAYKRKVFDQEGLLEFHFTEALGHVAGFDNMKRWLAERKPAFLENGSGFPEPKGLLLMGVQGCGKSLAVKAIAREFGLPLYRLDLGRLYSKYIGETEENLRKAFAVVERLSPLCLWIDEIEKAFAVSGGDIDGGVSQRILGTFLTWMQERKSRCFVAATANDVYRLPPEFLRKGRFDEIFFVDLPDAKARERIFALLLEQRGARPADFDLAALAARSDGFSGAEIEQAIISAMYRASAERSGLATAAVEEQLASTRPLSVLKHEEIAALRAWARERTIPA
jgi:AAA+ superfamily predicted ATPase